MTANRGIPALCFIFAILVLACGLNGVSAGNAPSLDASAATAAQNAGEGVDAPLEIFVAIDIVAKEPSFDSDGVVDVPMSARASAQFPEPGDLPVTVTGTANINEHPKDAMGCAWARTYAVNEFQMTVRPPETGSSGVSLKFVAPEWHYDVICLGTATRVPAFGELPMLATLHNAILEYQPLDQQGFSTPIHVPERYAPGVDCIKRWRMLQGSHSLGDVYLYIAIYQPPCLLPMS